MQGGKRNEKLSEHKPSQHIGHGKTGKTTLLDACLFNAGAVSRQGNVEQGTSALDTSAEEARHEMTTSLKLAVCEWKGYKLNFLDTPGYPDFVADVQGAFAAADSALILISAVSGIEVSTENLWQYANQMDMPRAFFINKMDREGRDAFDLLDELEEELQIKVRPLSWPIGQGQRFKGVYNIYEQQLNLFTPNKQRVTEKVAVDIKTAELDEMVGEREAQQLRDDLELVDGVYPTFEEEDYRAGVVAPVFFGSALNNFGVQELLNCFVDIAPSPRPTKAEERMVLPEEPKFTGFIFKITANIDPNHRSCIAFCKVCSGKFVRNQPYLHVRQEKTVRFSSPTQFMAQRKSTVDEAYPGDIVGLPDNGIFKIGDTLTEGEQLHFRGLPSFSPLLFKYIENDDPMKSKQFQKGLDQLMDEGVAQLFVNQFNGRKIVGTVGQLQFEVIQYRLEHEYNAKCRWEPVHLHKACWVESDEPAELENFKKRKYQYMAKDIEGRDVFLADSGYVLSMAQQDFEHIKFHFTSEF